MQDLELAKNPKGSYLTSQSSTAFGIRSQTDAQFILTLVEKIANMELRESLPSGISILPLVSHYMKVSFMCYMRYLVLPAPGLCILPVYREEDENIIMKLYFPAPMSQVGIKGKKHLGTSKAIMEWNKAV